MQLLYRKYILAKTKTGLELKKKKGKSSHQASTIFSFLFSFFCGVIAAYLGKGIILVQRIQRLLSIVCDTTN